jgi:hypothetical protein
VIKYFTVLARLNVLNQKADSLLIEGPQVKKLVAMRVINPIFCDAM